MNGTLELPGILVQLSHIRLPNVFEKSVGANTPGEDIRTIGKLFSECISNQQSANSKRDPNSCHMLKIKSGSLLQLNCCV